MKGKKYKEIEFETLGVDNSSKMVKLRIIHLRTYLVWKHLVSFNIEKIIFTKTKT